MKIPGVCTQCGRLTESGPRHPECGGQRPSLQARGYPRDWPARRRRQLARAPWCEDPSHPVGQAPRATIVDHVTRRRVLVEQGHADPDGPWNLQSLCATCHARKTTRELGFDPGPTPRPQDAPPPW